MDGRRRRSLAVLLRGSMILYHTVLTSYNRATVPELPDLTVVPEAFHASLAGRRIRSASAPAPLAVRGTPAELADLVGRRVALVRQRGKFLLIELDRGRIVFN